MSPHKHPFEIIHEAQDFLSDIGSCSSKLNELMNIYQPPTDFKYLNNVLKFEKIKDEVLKQKIESELHKKQKIRYKLATSYPVFYALFKLNNHKWNSSLIKSLVLDQYKEIFNVKSSLNTDIDPSIYYSDAYSCRDIFLRIEQDDFLKSSSISTQWIFQKKLIEYYQTELFKLFDQESSYKRKLVRFVDLLSTIRKPGARKNKHFEKQVSKAEIQVTPTNSTSEDGAAFQTYYPDHESNQSKIICRVAPKGGAKLSVGDDRLALRGRLNQQSARNIISMIDMNRLTIHSILDYFKFLWQKNKTAYVYNLILFCTGLSPEVLEKIKVEKRHRLQLAKGCHLNIESKVLSYDVLHQPKSKAVVELTLTDRMVKILVQNGAFFSHILDESRKLAKKFKLHHPGQTPTPERISRSSELHFSGSSGKCVRTIFMH